MEVKEAKRQPSSNGQLIHDPTVETGITLAILNFSNHDENLIFTGSARVILLEGGRG